MMMVNGSSQAIHRSAPLAPRPDGCRERILNLLCEVRQDSRFDEWCRLTSALGLGGLTLRTLAELHDGAAEALFPELLVPDASRETDLDGMLGIMPIAPDGSEDNISVGTLGAGIGVSRPALPAPPVRELVMPLPTVNNGTYDGRADAAAS
jgi:hypothetical protein